MCLSVCVRDSGYELDMAILVIWEGRKELNGLSLSLVKVIGRQLPQLPDNTCYHTFSLLSFASLFLTLYLYLFHHLIALVHYACLPLPLHPMVDMY